MIARINEHKCLHLRQVYEPEENFLRLVVEEARTADHEGPVMLGEVDLGPARPIVSGDRCSAHEIELGRYVAYAVRNESYTQYDDYEEGMYGLVRTYTRSGFLDFARAGSFADDDYPGPITRCCFICLNHIVDVASLGDPVVTLVRSPAEKPQ